MTSANFWSSSENNSNNSWNVNFASSGNSNNNNKYTSFACRAVAALDDREKASVMEAYNDCCRDKMGSPDCVEFRLHAEEIIDLALSVKTRTYEPGLSDTFIVTRPKLREIFAAHFKDRIVQHWICLRLLNEIVSSVNSYSGFLVHGATYKIQKEMMYGTHHFWKVGYMWKNLSVVRVRKKYRLRNWLVEEERHRWRVMRAWEPRRRSGFPDKMCLKKARTIW